MTTFLDNLNDKYGTVNLKTLAKKMLKTSVNAGEIVINILGSTGIAGFKFQVPQSELVKFENDITDHYTDKNIPFQDHIAQKPVIVTVTGLVGDYFYSNHEIESILSQVVPTITLVKEFLPKFTSTFERQKMQMPVNTIAVNEENVLLYTGIENNQFRFNGIDLFKMFQDLYKLKSAQTRAFLFLEALYNSRSIFTVETGWKRFNNASILNVQAKRDKNLDVTEFQATFKLMRFSQTLTETLDEYKNRVEQQKAEMTVKGITKGIKTSVLNTAESGTEYV